jgi:hypothetical protein
MLTGREGFAALVADPNHQLVSGDATAHVSAHEEGEPPEHAILAESLSLAEGLRDGFSQALSGLLVVGHLVLPSSDRTSAAARCGRFSRVY